LAILSLLAGCAAPLMLPSPEETGIESERYADKKIVAQDGYYTFEYLDVTPRNGALTGTFQIEGVVSGAGFANYIPAATIGCTNKDRNYWLVVRYSWKSIRELLVKLDLAIDGKRREEKIVGTLDPRSEQRFWVRWNSEGILFTSVDGVNVHYLRGSGKDLDCFFGGNSVAVRFRNVVAYSFPDKAKK